MRLFSCSGKDSDSLVWLIAVGVILCAASVFCFSDADGNHALTVVQGTDNGDEDNDATVSTEEQELPEIEVGQEDFVATDEWQDVKEGQKIPPGLHVQMDFATGKKKAKLMGQQKKATVTRWDAGDELGVINTEKPRYTKEQLKAVLKDFKYQDVNQEKDNKKVNENFRSLKELKKAMKDMKMAVKTESDIVKELTQQLNQSLQMTDNLRTILIDLEYYLHQIDNAQLFCELGGLNTILKLINNSEEGIRESASHAVGAALSSNVKVQIKAIDSGLLQMLIRGVATDSSRRVQKKMLYALSTLLRQFPAAQKIFMEEGGLTALANLFNEAKDQTLQIKIITLLTDLLIESDLNVKLSSSPEEVEAERGKQYQKVGLQDAMISTGWCQLMPSLLQQESNEHDSVEKVLQAMSVLAKTCVDHFSVSRPTLQALMKRYSVLAADEEDGDDFFSSIHNSLKFLVNQLHREDL